MYTCDYFPKVLEGLILTQRTWMLKKSFVTYIVKLPSSNLYSFARCASISYHVLKKCDKYSRSPTCPYTSLPPPIFLSKYFHIFTTHRYVQYCIHHKCDQYSSTDYIPYAVPFILMTYSSLRWKPVSPTIASCSFSHLSSINLLVICKTPGLRFLPS